MRKGAFVKTIVIACCILANLAMAIDIPARHKKYNERGYEKWECLFTATNGLYKLAKI